MIPHIGPKLAAAFATALKTVPLEDEIALLDRHQVRVVIADDGDYPPGLRSLADAPPLLYVRSHHWPGDDVNAVGIVGSRACTRYGQKVAGELAADLARAGVTVVSGLARGIDGAAHRGALEAHGRTIAVLAGGLSRIYPPEHADLAEAITAQGALISETPMTAAPQPGMFPARNRIISGLCRGVVIVEAHARSGALITAHHALHQGREVFVVPGNVDSPASAGCLELIRKGAKLVRSAEDILGDLGESPPAHRPVNPGVSQTPPHPGQGMTAWPEGASSKRGESQAPSGASRVGPPVLTDPRQQQVWDALAQPRQGDDLAVELGWSAAELATTLLSMEVKRLIRRLPGNVFERR